MRLKTIIPICAFAIGASQFGQAGNITIYDKQAGGTFDGGGTDGLPDPGNREDQEVVAGAQTGQVWDLEAFTYDTGSLTLWGGFDFVNGEGEWGPGDIFIDLDGTAPYGSDLGSWAPDDKPDSVQNAMFGYDYAVHFTTPGVGDPPSSISYEIYSLDSESVLDITEDYSNFRFDSSDPFKLIPGDETMIYSDTASMEVYDDNIPGDAAEIVDQVGYALGGNLHNALNLFLGDTLTAEIEANNTLFHYTMECGNDMMVGSLEPDDPPPPVPDGGMTLAMLGTAIAGLALFLRRKKA